MQDKREASLGPRAAGQAMLHDFIKAAAEAGIVSGVQVKLLNELADDWFSGECLLRLQGC